MTSRESQKKEPEATIVEVEPGLGMVFGPVSLIGYDVYPMELLPQKSADSAVNTLSKLLGAANVAGQALAGAGQVQGLVRLAPETLKMLQTATPLTAGGLNLGTLVDANGKIVHAVRWMPAGAAGAVSVAASLGPALAMLAIQIQLAQISSLVKENLALTDEVLKAVRAEQWATIQGLQETMMKGVAEARHVGAVTDPIWYNFAGHESQLRTARRLFESKVEAHNLQLTSLKEQEKRGEYLTHHAEAILQDAQGLLQAQETWFVYQALRVGHLHWSAEEDPSTFRLMQKVAEDAKSEHELDIEKAEELLRTLTGQLSLMAELPGDRTLPFRQGRRSARQVARASRILQTQALKLRHGQSLEDPALQYPQITVASGGFPKLIPSLLRWLLQKDEILLAYADGKMPQRWQWEEWKHVIVTDRRTLILDKGEFKRNGAIFDSIPHSELRYVRFDHSSLNVRQKMSLDMVGTSHSVSMELDGSSDNNDFRREALRFVQLLQSLMRLSSEEIPASPLVQNKSLTPNRADSSPGPG